MAQEQGLCLLVGQSQFIDQHPCAAVDQFPVAELHVDHAVAFHTSQPYHGGGADHVEDHLLSRAAFHAGAAGDRNAFIIALSMQPQRLVIGDIEAKRQLIYQDSLSINGPQIAVVDGKRIYLDPLIE